MAELETAVAFEAFGARIGVEAPGAVASLVRPRLPPTAEPTEPERLDAVYRIEPAEGDGSADLRYTLSCVGGPDVVDPGFTGLLEQVCAVLESSMHYNVAIAARGWLFVHAGVVEWEGSAIVFPGRPLSGKSSLVLSLVDAGARYFSDEYAVFDEAGRVHPYPTPLSQRREGQRPLLHPPESLGDRTDLGPVPLARIVVTRFRESAVWRPERITPADAMMVLFDNTLVARSRPDFALSRLAKAVEGAEGLQGERGETSEVVAALLNA